MPAPTGHSLGNAIANKAFTVVDSGLQAAANGVENVNHAIWPAPAGLSTEDHIEGVYHSPVARILEGVRAQIKRGAPFTISLEHTAAIVDALLVSKVNGGYLDDRLYLLENVLVVLSRLPTTSITAQKLQNAAISLLWYDLAHPPPSLVGQKYQFRPYDGAGTSIWNPEMGKAGSPYARSIQGRHPLAANQLPSTELLFDSLLKREAQVEHPGGMSSCFFAFANLVIHSLFWTDHAAPMTPVNKVSSYLDLSPLYGSSKEENTKCRAQDGTGRIFNDTFVDPRLLRMPPSTPAVLILFARNHNYIVKKLLEINERGDWSNPPIDTAKKSKLDQDEELFQTARLINCGWFMSTILGDYLAAILGTVREGNNWSLDPLSEFRQDTHEIVERGTGNVVSVEFLALYHFHSSISAADEKWLEDVFKRMFPGKSWDEITIEDYKAMIKESEKRDPGPPKTWTFGGLQRNADGSFPDAGLAQLIQEATENPASAFKARGTPHSMRIIEIMAMEQNRAWGACSLNEFRKFLGLRPYKTFEEWNPRKDVANAARHLYQHPDNIELYVGLQAEQAKEPVPGAGLCPGFTQSRAILADAVALVRGDRFLTNDLTAYNLTSWGFGDCSRDPNNSSNGGMMGKLLARALPDHFPPESAYTNFPFMVPSAMQQYMQTWKTSTTKSYTFRRPQAISSVTPVTKYKDVIDGLAGDGYTSSVESHARDVLPGAGYFFTYNNVSLNNADRKLIADAFTPVAAVEQQVEYLARITKQLIAERSYSLVGRKKSVNIVRDVVNIVPVHFVSRFVLGLPLKTPETPHGTIFDQEMYLKFKDIYDYILLDQATSTKIANQVYVKEYCANLRTIVANHLAFAKHESLPIFGLLESAYHLFAGNPKPTHEWLFRLTAERGNKGRGELANDAVALATIIAAELSQALTHVVDSFLDGTRPPENEQETDWSPTVAGQNLGKPVPSQPVSAPSIQSTVAALVDANTDSRSQEKLKQLITDALRKRPVVPGVYREVTKDMPSADGAKALCKGDRVYLSFTEAGSDAAVWGDRAAGTKVAPQPLFAGALVKLLGPEWIANVILPVVTAIFRLKGLSRAPGNSGRLLSFTEEVHGTKVQSYLDHKHQPTCWSSDLTVSYTPN